MTDTNKLYTELTDNSIYEQHRAHFPLVSAYVIANMRGERIATIAIKYPKDGAGRAYAYLHLIGAPMVRGVANGYGYDKKSAALYDASLKLRPVAGHEDLNKCINDFKKAFEAGNGSSTWDYELRSLSYCVLQAV